MDSKKTIRSAATMKTLIWICCAFDLSCSSQSKPPAAAPPPTPIVHSAQCGSIADCAQQAVEAAKASEDANEKTRALLAALTQQVQGLQSQVQGNVSASQVNDGNTQRQWTLVQLPDDDNKISELQCPGGTVVTGIRLHTAGHCKGSCGANEHPLQAYELQCAQLVKK